MQDTANHQPRQKGRRVDPLEPLLPVIRANVTRILTPDQPIECHRIYALPIIFNEAIGFDESVIGGWVRPTNGYTAFIDAFLLMLTVVEDWSLGTPRFTVNPASKYYRELLWTHANKHTKANADQRRAIERLSYSTPYFRPSHAKAHAAMRRGKMKDADDEEAEASVEESEEAEGEEIVYEEAVIQAFRVSLLDEPHYELNGEIDHYQGSLPDDWGEYDDDPVPDEPAMEDEEDEEEEEEDEKEKKKKPWLKFKIKASRTEKEQEKAKIVYTPVYAKDDASRIMGYVMFIMQIDPNWDPAQGMDTIIKKSPADRQIDYAHLQHYAERRHPALFANQDSFTRMCWMFHRVNNPSLPDLANMDEAFYASMGAPLVSHDHFCNPRNWATPKNTFSIIDQLGGDVSDLRNWLSFDRNTHMQKLRVPDHTDTIAYHWPINYHNQVGQTYQGLFKCVWPHCPDVSNAFEDNQVQNDPLGVFGDQEAASGISHMLKGRMLDQIRYNGAPYQTTDVLQHIYFRKKEAARELSMLYCDPREDPVGFAAYKEKVEAFVTTNTNQFSDAMKPDRPTTPAMQAILKYAYEKAPPTITTPIYLFDEEISTVGNWLAAFFMMAFHHYGVEDPYVSHLAFYLLSTYDFDTSRQLIQLLLCGSPGTGKSWPFLSFVDEIFIRGTVTKESYASTHAGNVAHAVDEMCMIDEGSSLASSKGSASKDEKASVNRMKLQLETGLMHSSRAALRTVNGETEYYKISTTVMVRKCRGFTSNEFPQDIDDAVLDRLTYIIKRPQIIDSIKLDTGRFHDYNAKGQFALMQLGVAWTYKAISCGAIVDFDVSVYNLALGRMGDYLRAQGMQNSSDYTMNRVYRKIIAFLRHLVVMKAYLECYCLPGGAGYNDPNWKTNLPSQITPYLYPTRQLFCWAVMMHSHMWIKSAYGSIIQAACAVAGLYLSPNMDGGSAYTGRELPENPTIEESILYDPFNDIAWKRRYYDENDNPVPFSRTGGNRSSVSSMRHVDQEKTTYTEKADLNYITITDSPTIAEDIRDKMPKHERLPVPYINKLLYEMSRSQRFVPRKRLLKPQDPAGLRDLITGGRELPREEESVSSHNGIPVVSKIGKRWFIAHEAVYLYNEQLLLDALPHAFISGKSNPTKIVMPITHPRFRQILSVEHYSEEFVTAFTEEITKAEESFAAQAALQQPEDEEDEDNSEIVQATSIAGSNGKEEDTGDHDPNLPLPRKEGISFVVEHAISEGSAQLLTLGKKDPTCENWEEAVARFLKSRGSPFVHIDECIDDHCARQRHYVIGKDDWDVILTPSEIKKRYDAAEKPEVNKYSYPEDALKETSNREERRSMITASLSVKPPRAHASSRPNKRRRRPSAQQHASSADKRRRTQAESDSAPRLSGGLLGAPDLGSGFDF